MLSTQILPSAHITNPQKSYIKTIMNNVESNTKYSVVIEETDKLLGNSQQNSIFRQSVSVGNLNLKKIEIKKKEIEINIKRQIPITPIEKITYDSYIESDILKLLYFFKLYDFNIKIVCHSHLMQDLLNIKILNNFDGIDETTQKNILEIENNENIWSIILNSGKYCITRHAFTIANFYKENAKKSFSEKLSTAKFKQITDNDTKLSLYGILGCLNFDTSDINLDNCNNTVFVSILVRTWITAICLYLPKIKKDDNEFTLIVSPFIKESGSTYDNTPLPIDKQINIIKNFLLFLRNIDISQVNEKCKASIIVINTFFNRGGVLVINGEKLVISGKNKLLRNIKHIKNIKYTVKYDNSNNCFITKQENTDNFFKRIVSTNNPRNPPYNLDITDLKVLPGLRKPIPEMIKHTKIDDEPLNKNKIKNIINCKLNKDVKIGIIDIDEEGKEFTPGEIENFYNTNKDWLKTLNILVVCTQRSLSQGNTKHFQHLLKELFIKTNNTNFNLKNKKNTTQVIPLKSFSAISGSKTGLRTRVYTQGLDNDRLKVEFDSVDFSSTSSNEGAILCNIKYDEKDLIKVLNLYADVKENENYNPQSLNTKKKIIITDKIKKMKNFSDSVYQTGRTSYILPHYFIDNDNKNKIKHHLLIKKTAEELKKEYNNSQTESSSLGTKI